MQSNAIQIQDTSLTVIGNISQDILGSSLILKCKVIGSMNILNDSWLMKIKCEI